MIEVGTKVKMNNSNPEFNGEIGEIISTPGGLSAFYYTVQFNDNVTWEERNKDANIWRLLEDEFEVIAE